MAGLGIAGLMLHEAWQGETWQTRHCSQAIADMVGLGEARQDDVDIAAYGKIEGILGFNEPSEFRLILPLWLMIIILF